MTDSEPAKKKARKPRTMSTAATSSASNLKTIEQPALSEMHASIKETMVGNHELLAKASAAVKSATPTPASAAHSRELTKIVFEAGFTEIGVGHEHVEACCSENPSRFGTGGAPRTDEERQSLALKFAGKSLTEVMREMMLAMRRENPSITREEAVQRASATIDDELHRLQHLYELAHGIPGIDGIEQRLKAWLGVRPGATQNELEAELRAKYPNERPSQITARAQTQMAEKERKKKSAYQLHVSDDKIQAMLLRAFTENNDEEAGDIYVKFREHQIRLQAASPEEAERRMQEMRLEMRARVEAARHQQRELLANEMQEDTLARETQLEIKRLDRATGNPVTAEGVVVEPGIHGAADFLRAYNQDLAAAPEKVRMSHCAAMVDELMSAINLMAELLAVAPPDAVFDVENAEGDAIDNLYELLRTDHNEENRLANLSSETLHLYLDQWHRVQSESQSDIDRELVRAHKHSERDSVVASLKKTGLPSDQIEADMAFGVAPGASQVYQAIAELAHYEKFAIAVEEATEAAKLRQKLDQQATALAREANRDLPAGAPRVTKEMSREMMFESALRMLPIVEREYIAQFLCEPAGPEFLERPCLFGEDCVARVKRSVFPLQQLHTNTTGGAGIKAVNSGFVCREFLLPSQLAEARDTNRLPDTIRMCLLCNIYRTSQNVMQFSQQKIGCEEREPIVILQDHQVITNQVGEYAKEAMLPYTFGNRRSTGIVRPFLAYSDGNYAYSHTVRHGKRLRCVVETDTPVFRLPSASATRI